MKHSILKLSTFTFIFLIAIVGTLEAQKPKRAKILQTSRDYFKPNENLSNDTKDKMSPSGATNDWVVSSDRDNNFIYDSPNSTEPNGKTMSFMDNFYVIGESDTHVQLIKYDPTVTSNNSTRKVNMKRAEYYGWAPKENLLLWRNSLVNPNTDFTIKGLVIHSVERYTRGVGGEQQLTLYNSPTLEKTAQNENDIRLFEFLYIYDRKGESFLLGNAPKLQRSDAASKKIIKGWISEKNIRLWSQRLCIEPNSDAEAAAERRAKGVKATLFSNYDAAYELKTGKPARFSKALWGDDKYEKRMPPEEKRMPVLSESEGKIYKTGVITEVFSKNNKQVYSASEHAQLDAQYNTIRDKKQNINMIFVIDGTKGNHPFFVPIINSVKNSLNLLENPNKKYEIATFIYGKSGEGVVARQALTSNHSAVIQTLEKYRDKQDIAEDNDAPTDMYEGINIALRTLDPKETNIMVLIGDAGNALNVSNFDLIQKMKEKECGIISFQTRNVKGQLGRIYNEFINQTKNFIIESSKRNNLRPKLYEDEGNTYRLRYPIETSLPGSLTYSDKGGSMSQAQLEEEIRQMLKSFEDQHEKLLRDLDCRIYIDCNPGINDAVLEHILKEIPDIDLRKLRDMDYQLFVEAYAPLQVDKLEYPLFKHVLFLTDRELYDLERTIEQLLPPDPSGSELREGIILSYKEVIIRHYGSDVSAVANMPLGKIMESVVGLESKSDILNKYTLKELEDKRKVNGDELREIYYYIEDKLLSMRKIIGNPDYFFRSRDNTYYWVPQEMVP